VFKIFNTCQNLSSEEEVIAENLTFLLVENRLDFIPATKQLLTLLYNDNRHLNTQRIDPIFFCRLEHGDEVLALTSRIDGIGRRKNISPAGGRLAYGLLNRFNHCLFFPERKKMVTIDIPEHAGLSP